MILRTLLSSCLVGILLIATATVEAQVKVQITLTGVPKKFPASAKVTARIMNASSGEVTTTVTKKGTPSIKLKTAAAPSLLLVNLISRTPKISRSGVVSLFKPGKKKGKGLSITVRVSRSAQVERAANRRYEAAAMEGVTLVGVHATDFTAHGPGTDEYTARGEAALLVNDLAGGSKCYGKTGGYVIVETDPRALAAREREFKLCSSGLADPSTCVEDHYVPPDHSVRGSVVGQGSSLTVTLEYVDPQGNVISSSTESGPVNQWFETHSRAAKKLAEAMCSPLSVRITDASCASTSCQCCDGNFLICQGLKWTNQVSGTVRGPVGSVVIINLLPAYSQVNCGEWDVGTCDSLVCCVRAEGQPEEASFSTSMPVPYATSCLCPNPEPTTTRFLAQVRGLNEIREIEAARQCPQ